ncbi:MAG TPA: hypothetical protein DCL81_11550, partial [Algoriphagus sp.]|nr:hypothetical protein [Algoriphagus sp.]
YMKRTARGRMATELAYKHLKIKPAQGWEVCLMFN